MMDGSSTPGSTRNLVVVGASLGGIEALRRLAAELPPDLGADVLVVQHVSNNSPGGLARILHEAGPLPCQVVEGHTALGRGPGRILVAPPNRHLVVTPAGAAAVFGPAENRARPAIDPLFRTAAVVGRTRTVGVVLTGLLGDGSAGLRSIARCGGVTVVQDPEDADFDEMPRRALEAVNADRVVPLADLAPLLVRLTREVAPAPPEVPDDLAFEARMTMGGSMTNDWRELPGHASDLTCPDCGGVLRELVETSPRGGEERPPSVGSEPPLRFRCQVGHAYSAADLLDEGSRSVDQALWAALRLFEEQASMLDRLAQGGGRANAKYLERARENRGYAESLRELLRQRT